DISNGTKGFIDKVLGDVGKSSAVKQLLLGSISGWCTGFITMKVGKLIAVVVGGSIILLQVANHQGYIKVDWDKVHKQVEKVEDKATGHSPKWMEKVRTMIYIELISMILHAVERYVDHKLDKAEDTLKRSERKAKRWYHTFINGEKPYQVKEIHIFLAAFSAGVAIGIASG
ncbi:hypothetical protein L798_09609, partial [Zootermopsis nevadensis]